MGPNPDQGPEAPMKKGGKEPVWPAEGCQAGSRQAPTGRDF